MPWKPTFEGETPTLGFEIIDWYHEMLAAPDEMEFVPFRLYREQEDFIMNWYAIDPAQGIKGGRRQYTRGVLGRPRGWGKSPILGAISIGEACGPVVFDGWDANGQPVGRPWRDFRKPIVHVCACSDDQTDYTWQPIMDMLREDAPIHDHYTAQPYNSYVDLGYGKIERKTSSSRSSKGGKPIFAVLDQTEEWVQSNGGQKLADVTRSNVGKVGGTSLESPNAYKPGDGSVAEDSANFWKDIREGRAQDDGLYYDHREAPPETDLSDHDSLLEGLRVSYGDSSNDPRGCILHDPPCDPGHADLERNIRTIWDPAFDTQTARSDYLNQITHASDSWVYQQSIKRCTQLWTNAGDFIEDGEAITLGFDGSRGRNRGNADATALIGCRVRDGALFEVKVWQAGQRDKDWLPPIYEIDMFLEMAFTRWKVVGFYADPSGYSEHIARWESPKMYGRKLKVKATQEHPIAAWPRGKDSRVTEYCKRLKQAIDNGIIPIQDDASFLLRHLANARMRKTNLGYLLYKAYPDSPDKIDAAYAAVMAYKARTDALSKGITGAKTPAKAYSGRGTIS